MENCHYIYFHINPIKNEVFYVGQGKYKKKGNKFARAYEFVHGRTKFWKNINRKYGVKVKIKNTDLTLEEVNKKEIYHVAKIGRRNLRKGPLVNLTDGGDGVKRIIFSKESLKKISDSSKGRIPPNKGKKMSRIQRKKVSDSLIGNIPWNKGKKGSQDAWNKGKVKIYSAKTIKKMSKCKIGNSNASKIKSA